MTGFEPSELERAWAVLSPPRVKDFESFPLGLSFGGHPCRAALDAAGSRHLLVPDAGEGVMVDPRPAALGTTLRKLSFGGPASAYLDVSCSEKELYGEFDDVLSDILEEIEGSDRPVSAAVRIVARWRKLFRSALVRGLSAQAKRGLFAELTVLAELIAADSAFPVDAWRGPLKEPHDFEAPAGCIEVKAVGVEGGPIVVHGLDQLARHNDRPLDLVILRVVEDPDGLTIADLVTRLRHAGASWVELRQRLAAVGWHDDPSRPDTDAFAVDEVLCVRVTDAVPRLVPRSLVAGAVPEGIGDVQYGIELASLLPYSSGASLAEIASEAAH
jgi:hypothetical protein